MYIYRIGWYCHDEHSSAYFTHEKLYTEEEIKEYILQTFREITKDDTEQWMYGLADYFTDFEKYFEKYGFKRVQPNCIVMIEDRQVIENDSPNPLATFEDHLRKVIEDERN